MSRSGYSDDGWDEGGNWGMICWRGAVNSATKGKRGQAALKELLEALDAMPEKKLYANNFRVSDGQYCTLGVLGARRGVDMTKLDEAVRESDYEYGDGCARLAGETFGIASALAGEIMFFNDEHGSKWDGNKVREETSEERWQRMRAWVDSQITKDPS